MSNLNNPRLSLQSVLLASLFAITIAGCDSETDVGPTAEYGDWVVDHYKTFNADLAGGSATAAALCNGTAGTSAFLNMGGSAVADFYPRAKKNPSKFNETKNVTFQQPHGGYVEERATGTLFRKYDDYIRTTGQVFGHYVRVTAGNEAGVNIVPREDFVSAKYDETEKMTKITMNSVREKRFIRIRADYTGLTQTESAPAYVIYTDIYQIDCGSSNSRVEAPTMEVLVKGALSDDLRPGAEISKK